MTSHVVEAGDGCCNRHQDEQDLETRSICSLGPRPPPFLVPRCHHMAAQPERSAIVPQARTHNQLVLRELSLQSALYTERGAWIIDADFPARC